MGAQGLPDPPGMEVLLDEEQDRLGETQDQDRSQAWVLDFRDKSGWAKCPKAGVSFGIRDFPRKSPDDHAQKDDYDAPDIALARVARLLMEDFGDKVRVVAYNARGRSMSFTGISMPNMMSLTTLSIVMTQWASSMGKTHLMEVFNAVAGDAIDPKADPFHQSSRWQRDRKVSS